MLCCWVNVANDTKGHLNTFKRQLDRMQTAAAKKVVDEELKQVAETTKAAVQDIKNKQAVKDNEPQKPIFIVWQTRRR